MLRAPVTGWDLFVVQVLDFESFNKFCSRAGIEEYSKTYDRLTDATADALAKTALDLEARRHALKVKYYDRLKTVLSAKTAARFLQVENQILLLLDLQIASSLPIAE